MEAYELGFCEDTEKLYIGAPDGQEPILIGGEGEGPGEEPTVECLPLEGGTMLGDIDMGEKRIKNLADPTEAGDAVTRGYVQEAFGRKDMSNTDLNTIKTEGRYYGYTNMTNAPEQGISVMEVIVYSGDWLVQRFTRIVGTDSIYRTWERIYHSGNTWSAWTRSADYVVDQGTSGGWNYRKWNSGLCECYLGYAETVPSSGVGIKYGSITLPFTMANNTYYVGITPTKTATYNYAHDFNVSNSSASEGRTTTAVSYNYYYSSSAIYTVVFTVYIMGRWK